MKDCGDFRIIGIPIGMQRGFTKHCCFFYLWDSRATAEHYVRKHWPATDSYTPGIANIQNISLVESKDVFMPPLHIKQALMKKIFKAVKKINSNGFVFLCNRFPKINKKYIKEGMFVGLQIRKVLKDPTFEKTLAAVKRRVWKAFKWLGENVL